MSNDKHGLKVYTVFYPFRGLMNMEGRYLYTWDAGLK
jgi:hypothetical protein